MNEILDHGPLFEEEEIAYIEDLLLGDNARWSYVGYSANPNESKFWYHNLIDYPFFYQTAVEKIKQKSNIPYNLTRVYANGQTTNQNGSWHIDHPHGTTCLWYMNSFEEELGGKTFFKIDGHIYNYLPKRNHFISFPSNILHRSQAPTDKFNSLRISIAWKFNDD